MAGMNNGGALAIADDYRGGIFRLRNRRHRAGLYVAAWGVAGILSTTVPGGGLAVNPDHILLYFIVFMAGVLLLLLSLVDLPWGERAAARLEGLLGDVL
ncbi:unnamed protein product [Urochloa decumbens]|uniref:Uncharacterized protein n=1 Tax=Urochloa decumbens TaxID=240449 RepID=A0ABC9EN78_9POAL